MYLIFITIIGLLLRLIHIDKPEGLWNDEYVSWHIASTSFSDGFWQEIIKQCHLPFYYLYLKPFAHCSDLILRLTSVLPSVISIFIMYMIGKEFSKKTGYFCAIITATLPFLIYYAQEVRFYSLLFLFSTLVILFTIKLAKNQNVWFGYIISASLVLTTHVLGSIFVVLTLIYILYKRKHIPIHLITGLVISLLFLIPLGLNILKMLPSSQWWGSFSYTNILFLFSDYLSPVLTNNVNAPKIFYYNKDALFIILITFPTLLGFYGIIKGSLKARGLSLIALVTIIITSLLAYSGKIVFITKYTIEILPIFILLLALGLQQKFSHIIFAIFLSFQILSIFSQYYPAKLFRTEGHKLVTDILNKKNTDAILFTYYAPDRFERYLNNPAKKLYISKINRFEYIDNTKKILTDIKKGEVISIVFLDSVSFIPQESIIQAQKAAVPEMFITFSQIRNNLTKELNDNYNSYEVDKHGSWTVITAKKYK